MKTTPLRRLRDAIRRRLAPPPSPADTVYEERAHLLALLAAHHHAVITDAQDMPPGWLLLHLTLAGRPLTWHIHPRDQALFAAVERVPASDPRAQWDGHTTTEKYACIRRHLEAVRP
ncbi:hypothetical protein E1265_25815 [Streptomyces sp. 8K308]|uniref:hypothetical protein n=1 Tax=Streptomyces sp. 8K308 TaxID=2530388 RepID=UPI0010469F00|nr:hypothetical protein [Streptomyces sp. 8K308]TDC17905.1 hypothetical protein E1265_25815 [Streptomyces sp. 8K308]